MSVVLRIREMILQGELAPGERLREVALAERLGVSRTPIRQALPVLAREGLLVTSGARGYAVRAFTRAESVDAVRIRAALEGLAARAAAEGPDARDLVSRLEPLLEEGDRLLQPRLHSDDLELRYGALNSRFHDAIVQASRKSLLIDLIARCNVVPFTDPGLITFERFPPQRIVDLLFYAHRQHHAIADAIIGRDGARAEMLLREHATTQEASMQLLRDPVQRERL